MKILIIWKITFSKALQIWLFVCFGKVYCKEVLPRGMAEIPLSISSSPTHFDLHTEPSSVFSNLHHSFLFSPQISSLMNSCWTGSGCSCRQFIQAALHLQICFSYCDSLVMHNMYIFSIIDLLQPTITVRISDVSLQLSSGLHG